MRISVKATVRPVSQSRNAGTGMNISSIMDTTPFAQRCKSSKPAASKKFKICKNQYAKLQTRDYIQNMQRFFNLDF